METVIVENEVTKSQFRYWTFNGAADFIDGWFLMGTPGPILAILVVYLLIVLKIGPALMEKRKAFKLKTEMAVYNALQVLFSGYLAWHGSSFLIHFGILATKCVTENSVAQKQIAAIIYLYLLAKVSELLDTMFFVLRKKNDQVTFLHVYHHSMMMLATWFTLKYDPSYGIIFLGTLNSLVHVVMYTYYGLSAYPSVVKYLWWKRYITMFQLIQFVLMIAHVAATSLISECRPSYILLTIVFSNVSLMLYLFGDFYVKAYKKENGTDHNTTQINEKSTLKYDKNNSRNYKNKGV